MPLSARQDVDSQRVVVNVADRLRAIAEKVPDAVAVATPGGPDPAGERGYTTCTFRDLDADAMALARGLVDLGVTPGTRLVLLVPPSVEFVKLVFALLRSGATTVLVDPGMGRKHLVNCLAAVEPEGFVAVSRAQAVRTVLRHRFPRAKLNITVGRRWFWGGFTYGRLLERGRASHAELPATHADDGAAIIFTSGSTGPPKGVLYTHRMFDAQVAEIQRQYDLHPGGVDLACFALFGLFNAAMGVTTVFPDMDFSRPASAQPQRLLAAASDWRVTQAFASPAVWDKLSTYCQASHERILTLRKAFSCGAPVPAEVLQRTLQHVAAPGAEMHTPYGATEALPVSTIEAREVLGETAALTSKGAGVCVGRKFDSIEWRVIRMTDEPIANLDDAEAVPPGEIGELIVRGPQVTPGYVAEPGAASREPRAEASETRASRLAPRNSRWHRMGDVGYLDRQGRFWYQGRKSQRVDTGRESLFTERCEAIFRTHPGVRRCALVGNGAPGLASPVMVIESSLPELAGQQTGKLSDHARANWDQLVAELIALAARHECTATLGEFLLHPSLPVDVRHNSKINRESLAAWATRVMADHKLRPHLTKPHVLSVAPPASCLPPPA